MLKTGSDAVWKIHEHISKIKASEEMGVRYMQAWEERVKDREEGFEEGFEDGFEDGARDKACQTAHNLYDRGFSAEDTSGIVEESLETVRRWYQEWAGK